jgi:aminoglycoside phosphotransferase (APT) family kinase protein
MAEGLGLIPAGRRKAAREALAAAFGARPVVGWRLLQGGVSGALIWRVEVGERSYVLRLEPERVALNHRQRGYACMTAAAAVGVAPAVHYADPVAGVAIIDFVEARPLSEHPGGSAGLARALGDLIARIQATPPFPLLTAEADVIAALLANLDASRLLAPGLLDRHAEGLARIRAACPLHPSSFVSSHNDPNPRNMLFDGQRVWLVDWELAFRNDPLFDIAILTTELAATPDLEDLLVAAWAGRPSDPTLRARLAVTRLLTRLFYGCIALEAFAGVPRSAPETSLEALTPAGFRDAVAEGRLAGGSEIAWAFGKMSLAAFVAGLAAPGFEPALARAGL